MGGIGQKGALGMDQLFEAVCHLVDGFSECFQFARAPCDRRSLGQLPSTDRGDGGLDAVEWSREGASKDRPESRCHREHAETEKGEGNPVVADAAVKWRRRLGDEQHHVGTARRSGARTGRDGHGLRHVEKIVVRIVRALLARGVPGSGRADDGFRAGVIQLFTRTAAGHRQGVPR